MAVIVLLFSHDMLLTLSALLVSFTLGLVTTAAYLRYLGDRSGLLSTQSVVIDTTTTDQPSNFSATRYHEETSTAQLPAITDDIDIDDTPDEKPRRGTRRQVDPIDGTDNQYRLTASTWLRQRPALWTFWRQSTWHYHATTLVFATSPLIDTNKILRVRFDILDSETRLLYFRRLHWWMHGLKQITLTVVWLTGVVALLSIVASSSIDVASFWLIVLCIWSAVYLVVTLRIWFRWLFTYLIVTDKRLVLHYDPPVLPRAIQELSLAIVTNTASGDQSIVGKRLNFGKLLVDVPGDKDQWAHSLRFVSHVHALKAAISELIGA